MSGYIHQSSDGGIAVLITFKCIVIVEVGGGVGTHGTAGMQRSEESFVELLLSFHLYVGFGL